MKHEYYSTTNISKKVLLTFSFAATFILGNLCIPNIAVAQQGRLGAKTISTSNVILNEFTTLTANAASGTTTLNVTKSYLDANLRFVDSLKAGELVMIIQMQGAGINTTDTMSANWGAVTSYNNAGLFEFDQVASVPNGTMITLVSPLKNSYTITGNVQVVRVPRYTTFTINAGSSITTDLWNGTTGGIISVETNGVTVINGTVNANGAGFKGGVLKETSDCCPNAATYGALYASRYNYYGGEKGESIAGNSTIYASLNGRYGRGAPANGGGGGNDHNTAGGGGSNANNGVAYNGFGNPDTTTDVNWKTAWDLDGATANFHLNTSSGGGRGGYSYAANNPSPFTTAPGNSGWGGDYRENVGGHGGRPLDNTGNRIFFGGGGGSGDANDGYGSAGANGGGIVYIISGGALSGSGSINAIGDTAAASVKFDAAGGAGGGGTVVIFSNCSAISNVTINAYGGKGGDQTYPGKKGVQESEGPGGGGGGGYVSTTNANSLTINISGGVNGTTNSAGVTAFIANGSTKGGSGLATLNPSSPYSDGSIVGAPSVSALPASPSYCTGGSASLTASGATSYSWSPASGLSATTGASVTANPATTTTYTITGTNGSGCSNTYNVTVTVNTKPTISALPATPAICAGSSVNLAASGGSTYIWSPSTGLSASTGDSVIANPSSTASSTVTGTSAAGCSNTSSVTVTVNSLPTVSALPLTSTICSGAIVPLSASGGSTYAWSPSTGLSALTGASVSANPTTTTSYTVTGTNGSGCSNTSTIAITVNPLPTVLINPATPVICNGTTASLNASGANTYIWSPALGLSAATGTTVTANPATTSSYTITGTDGNNCSSTTSITVTVLSALTINVTPAIPAVCAGKSTSLDAVGANTFVWSPSTGLSSTSGSTVMANPISTTTYKVVGSAGGCSDSTNVTVTVNSLPSVSLLPLTPAICNGQSIPLNASGASTYNWSPASSLTASSGSSVSANPSSTSTYTVTGTDGNGCTNTSDITVTVNQLPTIGVLPASPAICIGQFVPLNASGGNTYSWSPASGLSATTGTSVSANPAATTTYTITGTDGNGCSNTSSVSVTVNPLPSVEVNPPTPAICAGQFVTLDGKGANIYTWSPAPGLSSTTGTLVDANPSSTSTYTLTGTDGNGCSSTATVTVTVNPVPSIGVLPASPAICIGKSVALTANGGSTYAWSPASGLSATSGTSVNANPASTSTYTITGTDANGCSNTASVTLTVNPLPSTGVLPAAPAICQGKSVALNASGATTYSWSPASGLSGTTGTSVNANPAGTSTYIVTGTDGNGCTSTASATVTVNGLPAIGVLPASPAICAGKSVALNANGGNTYAWSPASGLSATTGTSVNANPASTSTYTITGTDANGCSNTTSVTLTVNPLPSVGVLPAAPAICTGNSVTLNASGASTYAWNPASGLSSTTGVSVNANPAGTSSYIVTGTDGNGCSNTSSVTVTVNPLPSIGVLPASPTICSGKSVALSASGGSTYSWSPASGLSATSGTSVNASPAATSTYTITGTDGNGCSSTASATVTVNSLPAIGVLPSAPSICAGKSVAFNASGGNTYSWSPASGLSATSGNSVNANPASTSTYTITGTDANGCSNTASVTLTVNPLPAVSVLPAAPAICFGKSVALTVSGATTYSWSPASGLSSTTGVSVNANPSGTSSYIVTGTDGNGCTNTSSVTVTVNPLPSVGGLPASPSICLGKSVALNASGATTYTWGPASGLSATTGTSVNANPTSTSTYTITGTDGNGCSNSTSVSVTVNSLPAVSVLPAAPAICNGQSVALIASGGNTYSWSPASGLSATTGISVSANPSTTSSYIVTGTDANGCSNTASATVTVHGLPSVGVLPTSPVLCAGQSVALNASGATSYSWSPASGLSTSTGSSVTANPSATASYIVTGTDGNGCSNTASAAVTVNPLPAILINPNTPVICNGQSVPLNASGANTYSWSPALGLSASTGSSVTANPASTSSYVVTGTDVNGCSSTANLTVTVLSSLVISVTPTTPAICNGKSTSLTAGGANTFVWSPATGLSSTSGSTVTANPTSTTTYKVIGAAGGCSDSTNVTVTVNLLPTVNVLPTAPAICNGKSVALNANGGNTYAWSPALGLSVTSGASVNANPSATSTYIVTGTDGNGCSSTSSVTVTVNSLPSIGVLPASTAICAGNPVALTANGGSTYAWSPALGLSATSGTSVNANPSATSSYIVTGTDGNGCSNTATATVTVNPLPSIGVLPAAPAICADHTVALTANGGNTYSWSPASGLSASSGTSVNAGPSTTSTYIVTGTDGNGCSNTSSVTVTVNPLPTISVLPAAPAVCAGSSIALTASGGSTYAWNPAPGLSTTTGTTVNAGPSATSTYIVSGTDGKGCTNTSSITVTVNPLPVINAGPDLTICPGDSAQLTIIGDPVGSTYLWSPSAGLSCTGCKNPKALPALLTNYVIAVTNPAGCVGTDTVAVNLQSLAVKAGPDTAICSGSFLQLNASGGTAYRWFPTAGLTDSMIANPMAYISSNTTYTVTITSGTCSSNVAVSVIAYPAPVSPNLTQSKTLDTLFCSSDPSYVSYQWYFNSVAIPSANGLYYLPKQSGNYNVAITDINGCSISVGINIIITGIAQNQFTNKSIYVFPDPANDYIFVHALSFNAGIGASVSLSNVLGEQIITQSFGQDWNGRIDTKGLAAGIYFIQIINKDGGWVGRFLKYE